MGSNYNFWMGDDNILKQICLLGMSDGCSGIIVSDGGWYVRAEDDNDCLCGLRQLTMFEA